jgi:23S rRNA (cytidine1920-2'-O)/16S rRNA (cytidine1409-2'-O)-methyltransferase
VAPKKRASFVALPTLLQRRFPQLVDPYGAITDGRVLVDGASVTNLASRVRTDASLRLLNSESLRGTRKLRGALESFGLTVRGAVALDLGAAAGGFTQALLHAGAARVYAVDAGSGQLRGHLRTDARVVTLERTNLSALTRRQVAEPVDVVVMDLSYLAVADALPQLDLGLLSPGAQLVVLVKPTFELHAARLAADPASVARAVALVQRAMVQHGWSAIRQEPSPITGSRGAVEVFVHAVRATPHSGQARGATHTRATPGLTPNDHSDAG